MYRVMCNCSGHVDFKRSHILNLHHCNKCGRMLAETKDGNIYTYGRLKGYFKVGDLHDN